MNTYFWIILAVIIFLLIIIISIFNRLKSRRNQIENAVSALDALFIKRSDLIPNLVTVVKQYSQYEQTLLNEIVTKRNMANAQHYQQDGEAIEAMKKLMVQVENYPELKASNQFTNLQYSWNEAEEQISAGRRFLSSSITEYNNSVNTFPGNIMAGIFGMKTYQWQYATTEQRNSPDAKNLFQ